jgi:hypothetical protein
VGWRRSGRWLSRRGPEKVEIERLEAREKGAGELPSLNFSGGGTVGMRHDSGSRMCAVKSTHCGGKGNDVTAVCVYRETE